MQNLRTALKTSWLVAIAALCGVACGTSDPGAIRLRVHATPPPDDLPLSPLVDGRAQEFQLWDLTTHQQLARTSFVPARAGQPIMADLALGTLAPWSQHSLSLQLSGNGGQQVLGLALSRNTTWEFGTEQDLVFELRRPLFFFGGSPKLVAPVQPLDGSGNYAPTFAPNGLIDKRLRDGSKLRVIDPNSITPLLAAYDRTFETEGAPVVAAAGTFDGQSLLAVSLTGKFYVVDTLRLETQQNISLDPTPPTQVITISPDDTSAVLLQYAKPAPTTGLVGRIIFVKDLYVLRSRTGDGTLAKIDIVSTVASPLGPPIAALYVAAGQVDVLFSVPPTAPGQPDCSVLSGPGQTVRRRYAVDTGMVLEEERLPYTTALAYTQAGERLLIQPCTTAGGAIRTGRVVVEKQDYDLTFPAPGTTDISASGSLFVATGSEDAPDPSSTPVRGAVRILDPAREEYYESYFDLPKWEIPWRITTGAQGTLSILIYPTNVFGYGVVTSPDLTHALILARVEHRTYPGRRGVYIYDLMSPTRICYMQFSGYVYHVIMVNLQSGAREQDYVVGVQNTGCSSTLYDTTGKNLGQACLASCDPADPNPFLIGYQDGYIPSAASVLFGR